MLIRIHRDLFRIERKRDYFANDLPLSPFEKLVLILEDRRFLRHDGVDLIACVRETLKSIIRRSHGGASTIDMQFVRTATGFRDKTLGRKLYEMFLSRLIQFRFTKLAILRSYLDCAFFGSGIYGCRAASRRIFDKEITEISDREAAELASMLVYPRPSHPSPAWEKRIERRSLYGLARLERFKKSFEKLPRWEDD